MTQEELLKVVAGLSEKTSKLRDDIFYGKVKNRGNKTLDRFNEILWDLNVPLTNGIKSLNPKA